MHFSFRLLSRFVVESIERLHRLQVRGFSRLPQRMPASVFGHGARTADRPGPGFVLGASIGLLMLAAAGRKY